MQNHETRLASIQFYSIVSEVRHRSGAHANGIVDDQSMHGSRSEEESKIVAPALNSTTSSSIIRSQKARK